MIREKKEDSSKNLLESPKEVSSDEEFEINPELIAKVTGSKKPIKIP